MRSFAPLVDSDLPVPAALLDALVEMFGPPGDWVVIGAAARDLALQVGGVDLPRRATRDVDIAVAAHDAGEFERTLNRVGQPTAAWQRRIVGGQQVDVLPFGGMERDGVVTVQDHTLNVLGLSEAAAHADHLVLPSGGILPVAALEHLAILKLIAHSDRQPGDSRDADDLRILLQAASLGVYGAEVWDDDEAMAATGFDHELAGAYRLGRRGLSCFEPTRADRVLSVADSTEDVLLFTGHRAQHVLLDAWRAGLRQEPLSGGQRRGWSNDE